MKGAGWPPPGDTTAVTSSLPFQGMDVPEVQTGVGDPNSEPGNALSSMLAPQLRPPSAGGVAVDLRHSKRGLMPIPGRGIAVDAGRGRPASTSELGAVRSFTAVSQAG